MNSGLYTVPGASATARDAATARRLPEPTTKFSNRSLGSSCTGAVDESASQPASQSVVLFPIETKMLQRVRARRRGVRSGDTRQACDQIGGKWRPEVQRFLGYG